MIRRITLLIILFYFLAIPLILFPQAGTLKPTLTLSSINGMFIPYQNGIPIPSFGKQNRQVISLNGIWKKQRFNADHNISLSNRDATGYNNLIAESQDRHLPAFDDTNWENKKIPGVENIIYTFPKVPEYYEDGVWYRYKFNIPDSIKEKFVKLIFYSVNYIADVWLNGNYLGYHEGGYTPFAFDVSTKLNFSSQNILAVRIDNPEWGTRNDIVPYPEVDWFNYAGIVHDVYLEISNPVSVIRADIVPKDIDGNIQTTITILNNSNIDKNINVNISFFNADITQSNIRSEKALDLIGIPANVTGNLQTDLNIAKDSIGVWRSNLQIENPQLWSPKFPNLYVLKVSLYENGKLLDEFHTQFGIRTIVRSSDKILLNNKVAFFTGVARHEDHPLYGRSIPLDTIFSDLEKVKGINANFLRTAHYPNHPFTYLIADRLGIAIMEEIPVWQFDLAEAWQIQNNDRHIHEQMFKEMIFKDFNRPSILLWSTCNECKDVDNRKLFIQKMREELNTKFPDGRLVTQSAAADRPGPDDASQAACDVAGWTLYFGIFYGSSCTGPTNNFLLNAKVKNPGKPIFDTEFGYWSSEDNSTTDRQVRVFNETFSSFKNFAAISANSTYNPNGFIAGITWWCIFDWYSHGHPNGYQSMGLYSMDRNKIKPVGITLKDNYAPYFNLGGVVTNLDVESEVAVQNRFRLEQNFPNPFNPTTIIKYSIPALTSVLSPRERMSEGQVRVILIIYDILGREVATLVNEYKSAGIYKIEMDGSKLSSGIYFYTLTTNNYRSTRKMILLK